MLWVLVFIVLGLVSATLSHYNKNYYVGVFNDILGKEEDERAATRVGRGFIYGFFFLIYLALIVIGLIVLLGFLVIAGIIAAIIFVMVWVTENILPNEWFGNLLLKLYSKIGMAQAAPPATSAQLPVPSQPNTPMPSPSAPPTTGTSSPEAEKGESKEEGLGINVTRRHSLD
ncbi:MAG: hypothetical protein WBG50_21485 [Desulfomonilaceae bacterium]